MNLFFKINYIEIFDINLAHGEQLESGHIARTKYDTFATFTSSSMFRFLRSTYKELIFRKL